MCCRSTENANEKLTRVGDQTRVGDYPGGASMMDGIDRKLSPQTVLPAIASLLQLIWVDMGSGTTTCSFKAFSFRAKAMSDV